MLIVLPFWLIFVRGLLGVAGWGTVMAVLLLAPILFIFQLISYYLLTTREEVRSTRQLGSIDSISMTLLYISVFLFGFFFVDGGDTQSSVGSVATKIFGIKFENDSSSLASVFELASIFIILFSLGYFIFERSRKKTRTV